MTTKTRDQVARRFGKALRSARAQAGLTQHELEARSTISRSAIARFEAGRACPDLDVALLLAKALDLSLDELA